MKTSISTQTVLKNIATLGFIGYLPYAPGTFGSLFALILFVAIEPSLSVHFLIITGSTILGVFASSTAEIMLGEEDSKKIVIDEFSGFFVAVFMLPGTSGFIIAAFVLFRIIDILKPFMIKRVETTLKKGLGIMADDILAGVSANIILQVWRLIV